VSVFLSFADKGSSFVYGYLVTSQPFNLNRGNVTFSEMETLALEVAAIYNNQGYFFGRGFV